VFGSAGGGGGIGHGRFGGYGNGGRKIAKPIDYPADLQLPLSDGRSCKYKLMGAVIHLEACATLGHYTSYVRKPGHGGKDRWYRMDDSFVDPVEE
jgi:ubiquitin C-terminal hydrolase